MEIKLFKTVWFEREQLPGELLHLFAFRLDTAWNVVRQYNMRYLAAEFVLLWPRAFKLRLDFAQYSEGGFLEPHIDHTYDHEFQANAIFLVRKPERGGELKSERFLYEGRRLKIIRPNIFRHEVTRVEKGERWVLNLQFRISTDGLEQTAF